MKLLLRHPYLYLTAHWTITAALAAALLLPHHSTGSRDAGSQSRTITLLTGQVVKLNGDGTPRPSSDLTEGRLFGPDQYALPKSVNRAFVDPSSVDPSSGDQESSLHAAAADGSDGQAGLASMLLAHEILIVEPAGLGFFDPQLFDVSYQAANGFDDASNDTIPVIVQFASEQQAQQAVARGVVDNGIHLTHAFEYVPDAMGYVSKHGPFVSPNPGVDGIVSIYLDAREQVAPDQMVPAGNASANDAATPLLNDALPLIGADVARKAGLTGNGIKIAVVDTGIDAKHPDFQGRIVASKDFSTDGDLTDHFGHGTHVAGIAAGTGAASDGKYGGVAPAAQLISAKALSKSGSGSASGIMKAMEWAADQGARIENMSLGGGASDGKDILSQEVNAITAKKNVLFVIAAGNSGPNGKVSTPAAADSALAVAAIDKSRVLAPFSSRGPRTKDMAVKPDIAAPGVRITAPRANYGDQDPYATYSGTSMASPMVAGAAALVMQLHPDWPALKVKDALMNGATPIGDQDQNYVSVYDQGAGMVDLRNMVAQKVLIQPANLSFGVLGGKDRKALEFEISNLTNQAMTVDLLGSIHKIQGSGQPTMELSDAQTTLPPSGKVTVRLEVRGGEAKGLFSGDIVVVGDNSPLAHAAVGFTVK